MAPQAPLNPKAPEFFPDQHQHRHQQQQAQSISWPGFATSIPPQQSYLLLSSSASSQLIHPLLPHRVYHPATTLPSTSIPFHDGNNLTKQLSIQLLPLLTLEAGPTRFFNVSDIEPSPIEEAHVEKQKQEELVAGTEEAGSNGLAQNQILKAIIGCGRMNGRRGGLSLQAYAWKKKGKEVGEDQDPKHGHYLKNRQSCGRADKYFRAFPNQKRCCPAIPVRVDGDETTVMIKNIPNKYTRAMLVEFLDNHCRQSNQEEEEAFEKSVSAFDFVYLPIDFKSGLNKGYAFVNFTSPKAAWKFNLTASNTKWDLFQSHKIREVVAARLQGKEKLQRHFETMNFPCESEEVLPVCFSPPRDGVIKGERRTIGRLIRRQQA